MTNDNLYEGCWILDWTETSQFPHPVPSDAPKPEKPAHTLHAEVSQLRLRLEALERDLEQARQDIIALKLLRMQRIP